MDKRPLILGAVAVLGVLAALGYYRWRSERGPMPPPESPVAAATPAQAPAIRHPIPAAEEAPSAASEVPPPPLEASDTEVRESFARLVGEDAVQNFLVSEEIIRKIVATVDGLPRAKLAVRLRPIVPAPGGFEVGGAGSSPILDPKNFARYRPAVQVLETISVRGLAALYFRFYPLFQQAYEELGYPDRYFNDRVIEAIDDLLAAPEIDTPIALARPHVLYEFADPGLESRSTGQKLLVRMGVENARVIKAKLTELRGELTRGTP